MANTKIELRNTMIAVEHRGVAIRFRVDSATVHMLDPSRRPIHVRFKGPQGSATIELPRTVAWMLVSELYERTIVPRPRSK